ncbi:hypothetical protein L5515_006615 [Caenorhabditis briggsae]|uniref:Uncharacterized protein n=1 Tax=Caenorhabditis briggsae TaxID=6238 RepID=A0AAE9EWE5_CAEBR|nr:hypothetical protein L5515_006615 [Caenorhabditis briggsae]
MFEEIYFWSKNGRPDAEKNHDLNSACHVKLRCLKTEKTIVKTYHMDFGEGQAGIKAHDLMDRTVFRQDIAPYVSYSVNKKKRWEMVENEKIEILGEVQKLYDDMEVLILDRVQFRCPTFISGRYYFHDLYFNWFPIRNIHRLHEDKTYQCTSVNSVFGEKIEHFSPESRSSCKSPICLETSKVAGKTKVAYHIITPPKNYEALVQKSFHPGRVRMKWWWSPEDNLKTNYKSWIDEDYFEWITYDALMDREWDDVHEWDEEGYVENEEEPEKKCYNLEDHFVDKWTMVKRTAK